MAYETTEMPYLPARNIVAYTGFEPVLTLIPSEVTIPSDQYAICYTILEFRIFPLMTARLRLDQVCLVLI